MTEREQLLSAILANSDEDTVRLVYADWLDEHGQGDFAAYIRRHVAAPDVVTILGPSDSIMSGSTVVARGERSLRGKGVYPDGKLHVSRGFVSAVVLPAAAFLGGECPECAGNRVVAETRSSWAGIRTCPVCRAEGRIVGIARELFQAHPLQGVTFSDREPDPTANTAQTWSWWEGDLAAGPAHVPAELFGLIAETPVRDWDEWRKTFLDRDEALAALSAACVAYGRSLVNVEAAQ